MNPDASHKTLAHWVFITFESDILVGHPSDKIWLRARDMGLGLKNIVRFGSRYVEMDLNEERDILSGSAPSLIGGGAEPSK